MAPQSDTHEPLWAVYGSRSICKLLVKNDEERIRKLLEVSPTLINARHPLGWTPLHAAVLCSSAALLKFILDLPGIDITVKDKSTFNAASTVADILCRNEELCPRLRGAEPTAGATLLHFACMRGELEILKLLFAMDSDGSSAYDICDDAQRTPKEYFNLERVELETLKTYQNVSKSWRARWRSMVNKDVTVLCHAIRQRDYDYCKEIIDAHPDLGQLSYRSTFKTVVSTLKTIKPTSVDINRIVPSDSDYGSSSTALHYACLLGDMKIADLLLRNGAKWSEKDSNMMLPEAYVRVHGDDKLMEFKKLCEEENERWKEKNADEERRRKAKMEDEEEVRRARKELEDRELRWAGELAEHMEREHAEEKQHVMESVSAKPHTERASKALKRQKKMIRRKEAKEKRKAERKKIAEDKFRLRHLEIEKIIGANVIGQRGPIRSIASAIRLRENGWVDPDRPLVMLFLGSSGIGKTEIAKRVARYLHRDMEIQADKDKDKDDHDDSTSDASEEKNKRKRLTLTDIEKLGTFVRIDMSEYQHCHTVSNLTGSPKGYVGYEDGGILTKKLKKNPKAVVLLDEIEKAHPDVLTVFLQLFDDGRITDPKRGTIYCPNAVFIMTSNLGSEEIREAAPALHDLIAQTEAIDKHEQYLTGISRFNKGLYPVLKNSLKRDEFLGRINQIVVFLPFSDEEINQIVEVELNKWKRRAQEKHQIRLSWSPEAVARLGSGYDVNYGARSVTNEVKSCAIQLLAEAQIRGDIQKSWSARLIINKSGNMDLEKEAPQSTESLSE